MQNVWQVVDLFFQNPHWWYPIISSANGVNHDRTLARILYVVYKWHASIIATIFFSTLLINLYKDRLLPLLRLLIPSKIILWISKWSVLPPALINSVEIWSDSWQFVSLNFSISISTSKALGSGTSGDVVCINWSSPLIIKQIYTSFYSILSYCCEWLNILLVRFQIHFQDTE